MLDHYSGTKAQESKGKNCKAAVTRKPETVCNLFKIRKVVFQLKSFNNQNYLSRMKGEFWKTDSNGGRVYESPH